MSTQLNGHASRYMVKTCGVKPLKGQALAKREAECLHLTALGYQNKEIAHRLSLSDRTVETYRKAAIEKLGARNATHAVTLAIFQGVIQFQPGEVYVT